MVSGAGRGKMEGWKDLPMELLLRILSLLNDDRIVVVVSAVCKGWRDALCLGLTSFSLSWYCLILSPSFFFVFI